MDQAADRDYVESLARGLAVIEAFANQQHQLSIARISHKTGIARAAVRRYLHTLVALGYVTGHDGGRFSLRPKVANLGQVYLSATALPAIAQKHLDGLAGDVGQACSLGVLDGADMLYLARANSSPVMSPRFNVGCRLPAHCTSIGLVMLADLPEADLEERIASTRFVPYTQLTVSSPETLRESLAQVRENGFAIADQQLEAGFRSIAVPVRDGSGILVAGMNVIVPVARATREQLRMRYLEPLGLAARQLGTSLAG